MVREVSCYFFLPFFLLLSYLNNIFTWCIHTVVFLTKGTFSLITKYRNIPEWCRNIRGGFFSINHITFIFQVQSSIIKWHTGKLCSTYSHSHLHYSSWPLFLLQVHHWLFVSGWGSSRSDGQTAVHSAASLCHTCGHHSLEQSWTATQLSQVSSSAFLLKP